MPRNRYLFGTGVSCLLHLAGLALVFLIISPAPKLKPPPLIETSFVVIERPAPATVQPPRTVVMPPPQAVTEAAPPAPVEPIVMDEPVLAQEVAEPAGPPVALATQEAVALAYITAGELDDRAFKPLYRPLPEYPWAARSLGLEGRVLIKALVDTSGKVIDHTLVSVEGHPSFGRAAAQAVAQYKFPPPRAHGRPVFVWIEIPVAFVLE